MSDGLILTVFGFLLDFWRLGGLKMENHNKIWGKAAKLSVKFQNFFSQKNPVNFRRIPFRWQLCHQWRKSNVPSLKAAPAKLNVSNNEGGMRPKMRTNFGANIRAHAPNFAFVIRTKRTSTWKRIDDAFILKFQRLRLFYDILRGYFKYAAPSWDVYYFSTSAPNRKSQVHHLQTLITSLHV